MDGEDIAGLFGISAIDSAVQHKENQITFENFIVQASNANILTLRATGKSAPMQYYNLLYDCLIDINAIVKKRSLLSFITWSSKYTVSKDANIINNIGLLLNKRKSKDYMALTKDCMLNVGSLIHLLRNYKYSVDDQATIISQAFNQKGGYRKTQRHRKKQRRRQKTRR